MSTHAAQHISSSSEQEPVAKTALSPQMQHTYDELCALYEREVEAHVYLQKAYDELQIMVKHQQKMFAVVKQLYGEQMQAASTDAVTGLPNHRAIMNKLEEEITTSQECKRHCAILFVDIDHFKQVNDTWGHRAGDAILQEVANRLRTGVRENDFVGRYGGEEFAIVLSDSDLEVASQVGERLRAMIADEPCTWEVEDTHVIQAIPVTASFGVATYQFHGLTRNTLIESADRAMYTAKRTGRNRLCIADAPEVSPTFDASAEKV